MALAAGSFVVPAADIAAAIIQTSLPLFGIVESTAGGSPPTDVVVAWENGTRVSYAVSQTGGGTPLLAVVAASGVSPSLLGRVVDPTALPNPGLRLRGLVVAQFLAQNPDGTDIVEVTLIQCSAGFYAIPTADVTPILSA